MGAAISSSAIAAAESLADDLLLDNTSTAANNNSDNAEASPPGAEAASAAALQVQHVAEGLIETGSTSPSRRASTRKSQPTNFFAPTGMVNHESEMSNEEFMETLDEKWDARRQQLIKYKEEVGTFFVSSKEDAKLSRWVDNQRQFYRTGKMSEHRFQLLQEIGFFDEKPQKSPVKQEKENTLEDNWEKYRQELIEYKKNHDTFFVSRQANKKLARWAENQRQCHRRGDMNEERIRLLQEIGFFDDQSQKKSLMKIEEVAKKSVEEMWEDKRQALIAYKGEHGTFFVAPAENKKLARWAENQRQFHRRGEMSKVRHQLLQEIGFFDELGQKRSLKNAAVMKSLDEMWEENRQELIAYKDEHGSFSFKSKSKLGRWVENQKRAHKLGKMSEKRIKLLQEIDFFEDQLGERREEAVRKATDAMWEKNRQELILFKEEHGDFSVQPKSKLGRWIENQRRAFKLYDMPAERAELMQQMGLFPERPEDMVDGRTSPRKKRKSSHSQEDEEEEASPSRTKKRATGSEQLFV
ncbi:hypothetical protein ACHAXM_009938 [Skeletonema potamos]